MTHLDLFSGIGGFTLAAQAAGFTTIGFSEIDPYACKILKRHWPDVPNYGDVGNVPAMRADLITGGPPCQPASCAGQRRGKEDDRWLWPETLACVERILPAFCLFENPTGLLSLNGGVEFEGVLSKLESLGYAVQPIVIPAVAVDARHRRDRVWIVAHALPSEQWRNSRKGEIEGNAVSNSNLATGPRFGQHGGEVLSEQESVRPCGSGSHVADSAGIGRREGNKNCGGSTAGTGEAQQRTGLADYCGWQPEPAIRRVADGISNRSHRLRCLGNAIVPQVAEVILKALVQIHGNGLTTSTAQATFSP